MLNAGGQLIAPWLLHPVQTIMLTTIMDKKHMTETDIQDAFHTVVDGYRDYRLFTNSSKMNSSVACAFSVSVLFI